MRIEKLHLHLGPNAHDMVATIGDDGEPLEYVERIQVDCDASRPLEPARVIITFLAVEVTVEGQMYSVDPRMTRRFVGKQASLEELRGLT